MLESTMLPSTFAAQGLQSSPAEGGDVWSGGPLRHEFRLQGFLSPLRIIDHACPQTWSLRVISLTLYFSIVLFFSLARPGGSKCDHLDLPRYDHPTDQAGTLCR